MATVPREVQERAGLRMASLALWYSDSSDRTEGIGLVQPEGSAVGVIVGSNVNFDFYLQVAV